MFLNVFRKLFSNSQNRKARRTSGSPRLQLLSLEDRITPTTFTVNTNADSGTGSLRAAIDLANATAGNDIINFSITGTITLDSQNNNGNASLPTILNANANASGGGGLVGTLTINGPGSSSLTISGLDGGNATRDFNIFNIASGGNLTISGVTVSGAKTSGNGGAFNNQGTLTVNNSTISSNTAGFAGGGIRNSGGIVTVNNSTISLNTSNFSAGISATGALPLSPIPPYSAMLRRAWVGASACSTPAPSFPSPIPPSREMLDLAAAASTIKTAPLTLPTPSSLTAPVVEITPAITTPS
jgi:hypothetical protein